MKKPPHHDTWGADAKAAWKRLEKNYRSRRARPGKVVDQLAWDQFRSDAGVKVRKGEEVRGYVAPGPSSRPSFLLGHTTHLPGGFWWTLDYPPEMKRHRGYWRACLICSDEIEPGQCSVHPVHDDELGRPDPEEPDWSQAYHVGCVPPQWWGQMLGQPRSALPRSIPWRPRITEAVVSEYVEQGRLDLKVPVPEAVELLKENRKRSAYVTSMFP